MAAARKPSRPSRTSSRPAASATRTKAKPAPRAGRSAAKAAGPRKAGPAKAGTSAKSPKPAKAAQARKAAKAPAMKRPAARPAAPRASRTAALPVLRIEVALKPDQIDPAGREAHAELLAAGLTGVTDVRVVRVYFLEGALAAADGKRAAVEVLADPVMDRFVVGRTLEGAPAGTARAVTVTRKAGVTDPEAESAATILRSLGLAVGRVKAARTFWVVGAPAAKAGAPDPLLEAARDALGNEVIEDVMVGTLPDWRFPAPTPAPVVRRDVPIRDLSPEDLGELSKALHLSLSLAAMAAVREHFRGLGREPSDLELETVAQTWSEHCKHKTLAGAVEHEDEHGKRSFKNLLKETVFEATRRLDKAWCLSVFRDNAGVIAFDDDDAVCMKVETHNHPSAIEPYGGAGTGIGGVIRDILGTGLGARPVASTDVFCFGPPDMAPERVPEGCLHPRRLMKGVVAGVRDYGNRMGIPTVNGAILFDPRYVGNPVVFCGCVGLLPRDRVEKAARPGDLIVAFGGRTGRDGIHGATFSSVELTSKSETVSSGAVQIGDAITEKKVLDVLLAARDRGLFTAITDCGAGGFSSAVGEMAAETGADVDLAAAPLKYEGLRYDEIWISEAQERMVAAVPRKAWPAFRALCEAEDVEAVVLGTFTDTKRLVVRHGKTVVGDLSMEFLHDGLPRIVRKSTFKRGGGPEHDGPDRADQTSTLLALLGTPDIGSKEWVIRQYDHEVQAGAVVRPLTGVKDGPSDAAVVAPKLGSVKGVVISNGIHPFVGDVDPYAMAWLAVDEALRNAVATGASLERLAILDNFTWGRCDVPERLGAIVRAAEGCRDAALHFGTPFVSGKDSLNNEFRTAAGDVIVVPNTLLISALGVIDDVRRTVTTDFKRAGDLVWVVGETFDECAGSRWYRMLGLLGRQVPVVRASARRTLAALEGAIAMGLVRAAHDLSDGGLAVAAAEMAFAGDLGLDLDLGKVPGPVRRSDRLLFSESATRFLVEVAPEHAEAFERRMAAAGAVAAVVGRVTEAPRLTIRGVTGERDVVAAPLDALKDAWTHALPFGREEAR
ncbi:MAG: phosphoribosylformylglycinamidine synthase subunit PurL [Planctomycetia bacterium]|nr:phosphoribosylformylglycinamidine synthase subunit PurL [Planctomycetia bacterium]